MEILTSRAKYVVFQSQRSIVSRVSQMLTAPMTDVERMEGKLRSAAFSCCQGEEGTLPMMVRIFPVICIAILFKYPVASLQ